MGNQYSRFKSTVALAALSALSLTQSGCGTNDKIVFAFATEAPGANCKYGGVAVLKGVDKNQNNVLDDNEVNASMTTYGCAILAQGKISRVKIETIAKGDTSCPNGGQRILSGLDTNDNGVLDASEVESNVPVCAGVDGTNGTNGKVSLVRLTNLPADPNRCAFGGTGIYSGLDTNWDGILQDTEVTSSQFVCSVRVVDNVIVEESVILPGQNNCVNGGVQITAGVDLNSDHHLQPNEISGSYNMCNQIQVVPGLSSLIKTSQATATQCPFGGNVMQTGLDANGNGVLDASEVRTTDLVCNGANGFNTLVTQTADNSANGCGARGGIKFQIGLDTNRNNALEAAEVTNTGFICNGYTGASGHSALVKQTADSLVCGRNGGVRIDSGTDVNDDGILNSSEIGATSYVCNGASTMVRASAIAASTSGTCGWDGGVLYTSWTDYNGNGLLDTSETSDTYAVCNGAMGWIVDVSQAAELSVCPHGGIKVLTGPDVDGNGYLSASETQQTTYVCSP